MSTATEADRKRKSWEAVAITEEQVAVVAAWAEPIRSIAEAWLFGSRVKGTDRPGSDFDIGIVLAPPSADGTDWAFGAYFALGDGWQRDIRARLGTHVSVEAVKSAAELAECSGSPIALLWRREP